MALICPKCEKLNRCDCKTCNPNKDLSNLIIIDYENNLYQCSFCNHKFNELDSLDFEWDKMHQNIKETISPEKAFNYITLNRNERKKYEKNTGWSEYWFQSALFQHFGIRYNEFGEKEINEIRIKLERDKSIDKILE